MDRPYPSVCLISDHKEGLERAWVRLPVVVIASGSVEKCGIKLILVAFEDLVTGVTQAGMSDKLVFMLAVRKILFLGGKTVIQVSITSISGLVDNLVYLTCSSTRGSLKLGTCFRYSLHSDTNA